MHYRYELWKSPPQSVLAQEEEEGLYVRRLRSLACRFMTVFRNGQATDHC